MCGTPDSPPAIWGNMCEMTRIFTQLICPQPLIMDKASEYTHRVRESALTIDYVGYTVFSTSEDNEFEDLILKVESSSVTRKRSPEHGAYFIYGRYVFRM